MYYRLSSNYQLRGWEKLPFALKNLITHKTFFFSKEEYLLLIKCNGRTEIDIQELNEFEHSFLNSLIEKKIIERSVNQDPIRKDQEYYKYHNRYMKMAYWSITGRCNLKCKHCFLSAPTLKQEELTTEECKAIIDELADSGIDSVHLTGGEPLIRNDFFELVDYMRDRGIFIDSVYTNGVLVTEELLNAFETRGIKPTIFMSFDGVGWHDWLRGLDGVEKKVIKAFKLCHEHGFKTAASMCLHKKNAKSINETVLLLKELGVSGLKICRTNSLGEWERTKEENKLTPEEAYEIYLNYLPDYYRAGKPLPIQLENCYASVLNQDGYVIPGVRFSDKENYLKRPICGHVRNSLYIDSKGTVLPCMALAGSEIVDSFPSLMKVSLREILHDSNYMNLIDLRIKDFIQVNPECSTCEYLGNCGGGCRGSALGEFYQDGGYLQIDPESCLFHKRKYPARIRSLIDRLREDQDL